MGKCGIPPAIISVGNYCVFFLEGETGNPIIFRSDDIGVGSELSLAAKK